ncbi:hypothetical protein EI372_13420 [Vibrio fluvialis]|jgi:hypothetical protein|nr:hypothetical protein [Vibrio fluvialis]
MVGEEGFDRTGAPAHDQSCYPAKRKRYKRKSPSIAAEALNRVGEEEFDRTGAPAHDLSCVPAKLKRQIRKSPSIAAEALNRVGERNSIGLAFQPTTKIAAPPNGNAINEKAPALLLRP